MCNDNNNLLAATVTFERTAYSVNEGDGPAQPVLVLSNPSSTNITVQVRDTKNTATSEWSNIITKINIRNNVTGIDYDFEQRTVTFVAGQTRVPFNVSITEDYILESNEDFALTIVRKIPTTSVTRGTPFIAIVTIIDDDRK